jgi:hypothetical protein
MIHVLYDYIFTYLHRTTVVVADFILLSIVIFCLVGLFSLRHQVNDLSKAVKVLKSKIISD